MLKSIDFTKVAEWLSARWAEPSTQRSVPACIIAIVAMLYAIAKSEPSSAILAASTTIYTFMNAVTPEKPNVDS